MNYIFQFLFTMGVLKDLTDSTILKLRNSVLSPKIILTILVTYCFAYRSKIIQSRETNVSQHKFVYSVQN